MQQSGTAACLRRIYCQVDEKQAVFHPFHGVWRLYRLSLCNANKVGTSKLIVRPEKALKEVRSYIQITDCNATSDQGGQMFF